MVLPELPGILFAKLYRPLNGSADYGTVFTGCIPKSAVLIVIRLANFLLYLMGLIYNVD
jgi:hypothetical protein